VILTYVVADRVILFIVLTRPIHYSGSAVVRELPR